MERRYCQMFMQLLVLALVVCFHAECFSSTKYPMRRPVWTGHGTIQLAHPTERNIGAAARHTAAWAIVASHLLFLGSPSLSPIELSRPSPAWAEVTSQQKYTDASVEEGWALLSKYYIDKTFNGQNWDEARVAANSRASKKGSFQALNELTKSLGDKYTRLVDKDTYSKLSRFDLVGAGILFAPDEAGRMSVSAPPMPGSSALTAGVHKGDIVMAINGVSTEGMTSFDVIDLVLANDDGGPPNLDLKLKETGTGNVRTVTLARQVASVADPVSFRMLEGTSTGYISLKEFNARSPTRVREAVVELKKQGATRFILDLRGNPGGTFQTAAKIAGIFMSDRPVTTVSDGSHEKSEFRTDSSVVGGHTLTEAPLVLWVDRGSASASEVLAGALHDNCRALVAGDRTFGKGLIQGVFGLEDGNGLIITVARYLTPAGVDINGAGVSPDVSREVGLNFLGGALRVAQDMTENEWALAAERQGGELCPPKPF